VIFARCQLGYADRLAGRGAPNPGRHPQAENIIITPARITAVGIVAGSLLPLLAVSANTHLPSPSQTIYKCEVHGKVAYTDEPCLGAKRLDVVPGRGVDRLSGTKRIGADVAREQRRDQMARALQPLTGMDEQQFTTATRRDKLGAQEQRECRTLESAILDNEEVERDVGARALMESLQQDTLSMRKRYRELRC